MDARDPLMMGFADQLVTSDPVRFQRSQDFLAAHPTLRLAGPSWGWLEAAYRSMAEVTAPGYAEAITTPMLICGAGKDRIVDTNATRAFAARLPNGRYVEFEDSEHEILMENDSIRARFWAEFDGFVGTLTPRRSAASRLRHARGRRRRRRWHRCPRHCRAHCPASR